MTCLFPKAGASFVGNVLAPDVTVALEIDRREDFTPPDGFREVDSRATGPATIKILQRV